MVKGPIYIYRRVIFFPCLKDWRNDGGVTLLGFGLGGGGGRSYRGDCRGWAFSIEI